MIKKTKHLYWKFFISLCTFCSILLISGSIFLFMSFLKATVLVTRGKLIKLRLIWLYNPTCIVQMMYNVQIMCNVQCTMYMQCEMCNVKRECVMCNVVHACWYKCAMCNVQCAMCNVMHVDINRHIWIHDL